MVLYTALLLNEFYIYVQFQVPSFYTFGDMLRTKIQSKNVQRAITLNTGDRVMELVHCTPPQ